MDWNRLAWLPCRLHLHRLRLWPVVVLVFPMALMAETQDPKCIGPSLPIRSIQEVTLTGPPDVTVVTSYFDIGSFPKGTSGTYFDPSLYRTWSRVFGFLQNPLVVFVDTVAAHRLFSAMRRPRLRHLTDVRLVDRGSVWAFDYRDKIRSIIGRRGYPHYFPNTVSPEYACVQHAKFYCLDWTATRNPFNTSYMTWLDVGYFRDIVDRKRKWVLVPPAGYDESRIAVNLTPDYKPLNQSVEAIFKGNDLWVGGGMLFGNVRLFPAFVREYRRALDRYLEMGLSDTDQQVIYAMHTESEREILGVTVQLQVYRWDTEGNCWFFLGYSCYREVT